MKKQEKGITLIALVITVIVMLILAGVAINLTIGDNGIFKKSDEGAKIYKNAANNEAASLNSIDKEMGDLINQYKGGNTAQDVLPDFTQNPNDYKHPDQSDTNTDRAIGTDGKPVNMDLWKYVISDDTANLYKQGVYNPEPAYVGPITDGKIQGMVPQYIYLESTNKVYTVTTMNHTFVGLTITESPEIPNTVTNMERTFYSCKNLTKISKIPNSVIDMTDTFMDCKALIQAPEIPSNVTNLKGTFAGCSDLIKAPRIPDSVTGMNGTFWNCSNLTQAPEIPSSVTYMGGTFNNCVKLAGTTIKINAIEVNFKDINNTPCFYGVTNITVQVPAGSTTYNNLNAIYASDSNVTIETF